MRHNLTVRRSPALDRPAGEVALAQDPFRFPRSVLQAASEIATQ